jgi:hypothetical protein
MERYISMAEMAILQRARRFPKNLPPDTPIGFANLDEWETMKRDPQWRWWYFPDEIRPILRTTCCCCSVNPSPAYSET